MYEPYRNVKSKWNRTEVVAKTRNSPKEKVIFELYDNY